MSTEGGVLDVVWTARSNRNRKSCFGGKDSDPRDTLINIGQIRKSKTDQLQFTI
jgi:hypothetical protein